uniref:Uncharacterized protein n=1 Tax=Romanomermis culicivorax TaxID=13658 RepID=A0A915L9G2_ROMCU
MVRLEVHCKSATCLTYNTCCSPNMLGGVEKCSTTLSMLGEQIFCARGSARRTCSARSWLGAVFAEQKYEPGFINMLSLQWSTGTAHDKRTINE